MYYKLYPKKDATIYSDYHEFNVGVDQIIEIVKDKHDYRYAYKGTWLDNIYYNEYNYVKFSDKLILSADNTSSLVDQNGNELLLFNGIRYYTTVNETIGTNPYISSDWQVYDTASNHQNSRILLQFDLNELPTYISNNYTNVNLNLYCADIDALVPEFDIYAHPISSSWSEGVGTPVPNAEYDGVTWDSRDTDINWNVPGGDYHSDISASQHFISDFYDINMNVNNIVDLWISGSLPNYGFMIKKSDDDEFNELKLRKLSYYSKNTHTVYMPELTFWYDDSLIDSSSYFPYNTSSMYSASKLEVNDFDIDVIGLKKEYKYNTTNTYFFKILPLRRRKTFYETKVSEPTYFIDNKIEYSIIDAYTNRIIIPFSSGSRAIFDSDGYHFRVNLGGGFMPERFYKILFKCELENNTVYITKNYMFKVVI